MTKRPSRAAYLREYRHRNWDKYLADARAYRKKRRKTDPSYADYERKKNMVSYYKVGYKRYQKADIRARQIAYNHSPRGRYSTYKIGAKRRGYSFRLSFPQFMTYWGKSCAYCGRHIDGIGIDRKNNSLGYTMSNIVPCCFDCNKAKHALSPKEYIDLCKRVAEFSHASAT